MADEGERIVRLMGVASGLGAPSWAAAGCARGPEILASAGLAWAPERQGLACCRDTDQTPPFLPRKDALAALCRTLSERVEDAIGAGELPIVVGGDHAVAAGTWRGAARAAGGPFGLLWIGAHLDAHTPESSPSGNWHGMPLAALLGAGDPAFTSIDGPRLDPRRVCVVGARSFDPAEMTFLQQAGVRIMLMEEVHRRGLSEVMAEALVVVGEDAFGLSLDLHALDPLDAPGVSTPVPDGLHVEGLGTVLRGLARNPRLMALEIVEFNPEQDVDGRTAAAVVSLLESLCAPRPEELQRWEEEYGARNYAPLPVVLARGEGVHLWDTAGRRYLDMMSAYSATSFGHAPPRLVTALTRQAQRLAVTSRAYHNDRLPLFLRRLSEIFGYETALPVNTGLEAVETALKAARKWAHKIKGVPEDQAEIIACDGNFHGRSIAIVGLSSDAQYRDGFGPFPSGLRRVPYGDAAALEDAITPRTAAFLVEPIQGEAGIRVPPAGYLAACAELCRRHKVLLICDEVQTGMGRTGRLLACHHDNLRPDGVILGKALGGGLLPVSAFLADRAVMDVFGPGDHGSTFGGNPLGAAVALEALNLMEELDLPGRSAELGLYLLDRLREMESPLVQEIRGRGLFIGIELREGRADAHDMCLRLLAQGILSKDTHHTVIRLAPPLIITRAEIDWAVERIAAVLKDMAQPPEEMP